jgi:hypothetical protein
MERDERDALIADLASDDGAVAVTALHRLAATGDLVPRDAILRELKARQRRSWAETAAREINERGSYHHEIAHAAIALLRDLGFERGVRKCGMTKVVRRKAWKSLLLHGGETRRLLGLRVRELYADE